MTDKPHSTASHKTAQQQVDPWDQVAEAVDALVSAWESHLEEKSPEPRLGDFVPREDRLVNELSLPELIKVDLEYRWQHDRSPRLIESYAEEFPALGAPDQMSAELIYEELQVRVQAGKEVSQEEIQSRFPKQAAALFVLLGGMAVAGTPTAAYFVETMKGSERKSDIVLANESVLGIKSGEKIDDFELLTVLGKGAFAQVFLACQISLERLVALKISSVRGNESKTLAQLDHPNIVRVFDQRQNKEPPVHLMYMEVVPGGTLLGVIQRVRKLRPADRNGRVLLEVVDGMLGVSGSPRPTSSSSRNWLASASWPMVVCQIGAQLARGLSYAHSKGVLHRDMKPANVLLTPEGLPKLADFNVSYNGGRADESPEDTFGGSLTYMSPEQLQACHPVLGGSPQLVRATSDVYSLGLLLWELLCGRRPFDEESRGEGGELARIQRMIDARHYVDFSELVKQLPADCPDSLRQVLVRCLQPRKEERFKSAEETAQALELSLHPRCWKLMQKPTNLLWALPLRFPILAILIAGLTPNALAGYYNLTYNRQRIEEIPTVGILEHFNNVQIWINSIAFPLGAVIGIWIVLRVKRQMLRKQPDEANEYGGRVLFLGLAISLLTVGLWAISGIIFPIAIDLGTDLERAASFYTHFFVSLVLCGTVAMAYPYFFLTTLSVRVFFPALVRRGVVAGPQWKHLQKIRLLNKVFLALTAMMPMFGVLLAVAVESDQRNVMMVACGVGIVGFLVMFGLERFIDKNLDALERIAVDAPGNA